MGEWVKDVEGITYGEMDDWCEGCICRTCDNDGIPDDCLYYQKTDEEICTYCCYEAKLVVKCEGYQNG